MSEAPAERTFRAYVGYGQKYACLAAAGKTVVLLTAFHAHVNDHPGSVYLLMVIAYRQMSTTIARLNWKHIHALAQHLRCPQRKLILLRYLTTSLDVCLSVAQLSLAIPDLEARLLPLLRTLQQQIPLSMSTLFSSELLRRYDLPGTLNCSDLASSDIFFCTLNQL